MPEVAEELGVGIFIIPTVAVLANVAIAKAFSKYLLLPFHFFSPLKHFILVFLHWNLGLYLFTNLLFFKVL